jgi:hypothetical protein
MKKNKVIGALLLILAVYTIAGMIIDNLTYWIIYNCLTISFSVISGIILLKEK